MKNTLQNRLAKEEYDANAALLIAAYMRGKTIRTGVLITFWVCFFLLLFMLSVFSPQVYTGSTDLQDLQQVPFKVKQESWEGEFL